MSLASTGQERVRTIVDLRRSTLLRMLAADGASFGDIATSMSQDPALCRVVLHVANISLPFERIPVQRLEEAFVLLGLRRVAALISGASAHA